jgi:hypothetical protein
MSRGRTHVRETRAHKERGERQTFPRSPFVATPVGLPTRKPTKAERDNSPAGRVDRAAIDAASVLSAAGYSTEYDAIRSAVIRAFALRFAMAYGMRPFGGYLPGGLVIRGFVDAVCSVDVSGMDPEHFGAVHEALTGYTLRERSLVPSGERRGNGIHFTPRELTAPIVATTLGPLIGGSDYATGEPRFGNPEDAPYPPARTLDLRVCDPSVGAGAFLLEVVRQLAGRLVAHGIESDLLVAKRLVAIHCCYGVDVNPWAVASAKIAIWLECRAENMPVGWLDDNLRVGDALVGMMNDQIARFHWSRTDAKGRDIPEAPELRAVVDRAMGIGAAARNDRMRSLADRARGA